MHAPTRSLTPDEAREHLSGTAVLFHGSDAAAGGRVFVSLERVGCRVRLARRLIQGLQLLDSLHPGLILVDADCTETDPAEAVRRLRDTAAGRAAIVVALGATCSRRVRDRIKAAGCDRYLTKPADFAQLPQVLLRRVPELAGRFQASTAVAEAC